MGRPSVSVAMCLFNAAKFVPESLDSALAQTFEDFEIVIVDDGSTDGCAELVERRYKDPRIRLIRQAHRGLTLTRRATIANAAGEYVAFLDSDDFWFREKLEVQMQAARAHPEAALLFSDCSIVDETGREIDRVSAQYGLEDLDVSGARGYLELLRRGCFVWQSTVVARKSALDAVDGYDPAYPYVADYDTWLRMAARFELHYTAQVLARWRVHERQFTNRHPDVTLADQRRLLGPFYRSPSIPRPVRIALGDRLLGQHRVSCRKLLEQRRFGAAIRAAAGMLSYPDRLYAFLRGAVAETPVLGPALRRPYRAVRHYFER